jgi:autophagy-related protein 2
MWTPDVKANQLADVISGVAPIRSLVNVGTGVADLLLLPIAQYKKDKRLFRGVQKGTAAFMKTTAMETIKLGARLATGTQVILEHAEHVLGASGLQEGQPFGATITTEAIPSPILSSRHPLDGNDGDLLLDEPIDDAEDMDAMISRYAAQPEDVREGIQAAYKSLSKNLNAAAQTILAVPMEVYEQSGSGVSFYNLFGSHSCGTHQFTGSCSRRRSCRSNRCD